MDAHNIMSLLSEMGSAKYRIGNRNVVANCPLAQWRHGKGTDKTPSLSVKIEVNGVSPVYCWSCKFRGTMYSLARTFEQLHGVGGISEKVAGFDNVSWIRRFDFKSYSEARKYWHKESDSGRKSDIIFGEEMLKHETDKFNIQDFKKFIWNVPQLYFKRGLTAETAKAFYIGFCDPKPEEFSDVGGTKKWLGKYLVQKGIFFPIFDHKNRFVGYTIRGIYDWQRKFLHAEGMKKEWFFYGENMIVKERGPIVIVEGPWDVNKLWQCEHNGAGVLGSSISTIQVEKIIDMSPVDYVIAMFDGDAAGETLHRQADSVFRGRIRVKHVKLKEGKDPDDYPDDVLKSMIASVK